MSELEVKELSKKLGGRTVVNNISFHVTDGEFFVILGPSGSGKSSILRLISGQENPDKGKIYLNGQDITNLHPHQRNLGVVFQDYGLFPTMNVFDNIAYGLQMKRLGRRDIEMRVVMAAEMLDLKETLKRSLSNLSGGELQRVAIARVLVKDAEVYLFDEPISHLDMRLRHRTRQEIMMVHRIKHKPCIYITHDQDEAFAMANRIAVLAHGKIQQIGTPDELMRRPSNLFVARFLGSPPINTLESLVQHVETRYRLRADGMYFALPVRWTRFLAHLGPQAKVIMGIRPNAIIPEWQFAALGNIPHVVVRAQIVHLETLIGQINARLRIGYGTEIMAEFEDTQVVQPKIGQIINIAFNTDNILLFHPQTEEILDAL